MTESIFLAYFMYLDSASSAAAILSYIFCILAAQSTSRVVSWSCRYFSDFATRAARLSRAIACLGLIVSLILTRHRLRKRVMPRSARPRAATRRADAAFFWAYVCVSSSSGIESAAMLLRSLATRDSSTALASSVYFLSPDDSTAATAPLSARVNESLMSLISLSSSILTGALGSGLGECCALILFVITLCSAFSRLPSDDETSDDETSDDETSDDETSDDETSDDETSDDETISFSLERVCLVERLVSFAMCRAVLLDSGVVQPLPSMSEYGSASLSVSLSVVLVAGALPFGMVLA